MKIKTFSSYLEKIESNPSRNYKVEVLADLFSQLDKEEVKPTMYLLDGRAAPRYDSLEYNISTNLIKKALESVSNSDIDEIYNRHGDVGEAAFEIRNLLQEQDSGMEILEVFKKLLVIAKVSGKGSQEEKVQGIKNIVKSLDPLSAKYISRMIKGSIRLGLNDKTILDAISWSKGKDKSMRKLLDRAYGVRSDLGEVAEIALGSAPEDLENLSIEVGLPVASKLVEREKDTAKIIERLGECIVQPKYDGLRAQIHFQRSGIKKEEIIEVEQQDMDIQQTSSTRIFSRNMEDMTDMFPDIVDYANDLKAESFVIDSEVIGYDFKKNEFIPFQETMTRKRKYDIAKTADSVPVIVSAFDCLFVDGEDITAKPLEERLSILKRIIPNDHKMFKLSESVSVKTPEEMEQKFDEYINLKLEGLIAKDKMSEYLPGTRNYDWIKLKATSKMGFVDSIDAVVIGYYLGRGYRTKFGMGALLVAIYDEKYDKYVSLAKVGTGITDEQWGIIKKKLDEKVIDAKPENIEVSKELEPDVWVMPSIVMEIEYDQITKSKSHIAAKDRLKDYGLSVRFPRMKMFDRDKNPSQATNVAELIRIFKLQ
jgi:DNA ligase-1